MVNDAGVIIVVRLFLHVGRTLLRKCWCDRGTAERGNFALLKLSASSLLSVWKWRGFIHSLLTETYSHIHHPKKKQQHIREHGFPGCTCLFSSLAVGRCSDAALRGFIAAFALLGVKAQNRHLIPWPAISHKLPSTQIKVSNLWLQKLTGGAVVQLSTDLC